MKTCAWVSRHPATHEQRASLKAYHIIPINPPGRLWSAADAIALSQTACGGWPHLFVVVMPMLMLQDFIWRVKGHVPVIRAVMDYKTTTWSGQWEQISAIQIFTQVWTPEKEMR